MADTAVYSADGKWSVSGTTASYKVGSDVVAKITGLASGLTADNLNDTDYITVSAGDANTPGTITLKDDALGTSAKTALTLSNGGYYVLDLALTTKTEATVSAQTLSTSSGKATVKGTIGMGYTQMDDNTIVYNASAKTNQTLATVSGLVSSIPDGAVALASSGNGIELTEDAFNKKKVTLSTSNGYTIKLKSGTDATKIQLGGTTEDATWSVSGTTATYKQTKTAQYTLADDGKSVTYTAAKTATLATVKGLAKGLVAGTGANVAKLYASDGTTEVASFNATTNTQIDLKAGALGTSKVTLVNGKSLPNASTGETTASTYTLALDNGVSGASGKPSDTQVWAVSGTTATYKTVTPAYYEKATDGLSVSYHKEDDGKSAADKKAAILATVKGLAKGLKTGTDATKLYASDGTTEVATAAAYSSSLTSENKGAITVNLKALNTTNATITSDVYKLALTTSTTEGEKVNAPEITPTWSVSGTTATLKGTIKAGWELSTDASKITYTKATADGKYATLATVKNLATGLTNGTDENAGKVGTTDANGDFTEAISVSMDTTDTTIIGKTNGVATITLKAAALGTKNITLSGTGYKLALDSTQLQTASNTTGEIINDESPVVTSGKDVWRLDGTTATYKTVTPAYYTLDSVATGITYTAEDAGKAASVKAADVIATVYGLKKGLTVQDDGLYTDYDSDGDLDQVVSLTGTGTSESKYAITLTKPALTNTNVSLSFAASSIQGALQFYSGTNDTLKVSAPTIGDKTWYIGDKSNDTETVAELRSTSTEGWTLNESAMNVTYAPQSSDALLAKVTGLKGGLATGTGDKESLIGASVNGAWVDYVSLDSTDDKQIVLAANALGEQNISVEGSYGYTFATAHTMTGGANVGYNATLLTDAPTASPMWVLSGTTANYQQMTPKYFRYGTLSNDSTKADTTKLLYNGAASVSGSAATYVLTGLAEGLVSDATDGQSIDDADGNDVIKFDTSTPANISINGGALDGTNNLVLTTTTTGVFATPTYYDSTNNTDGIIKNEDTYTLTYSDTYGTATLRKGSTEGYSLSSNNLVMVHTAFLASDEGATVASITGLAKGLVEDDVVGTYITHDETTPATPKIKIVDMDTDTAGVQNPVLDHAQISLNSSAYTFDSFDTTTDSTPGWSIAGGIASLYAQSETYSLGSAQKTIDYVAPTFTGSPLAIVTGLNGTPDTVTHQIEGVTFPGDTDSNSKSEIKLELAALGGTSVYNTFKDTTYEFKLQQSDSTAEDFVPAPTNTTSTWNITSGTLTYTVSTPDSYKLASASAIEFTAEFDDVTKITGLKSTLNRSTTTDAINGASIGITLTDPVHSTTDGVDDTPGTFEIGSAALGKKNISVENDKNGDDYIIALASGLGQTVNAPVWNKTNKTTTATYTQTFNKGYTQTDDKNIVYSSKKTKKTLATLTGLNKDVEANEDGSINGITFVAGASVLQSTTGSASTYITSDLFVLSDPNLFTTTNIALGKTDNYALSVAAGFGPSAAEMHWSYTKGTANLVKGTTEGWQIEGTLKNGTTTYDNKTVKYKAAVEGTPFARVTGLNSALEIKDDGTIDGLDFSEAAAGGSGTVYIGAAAVEGITGKKDVTIAGNSYVLAHADDLYLPQADEAEWILNKGTATYQYDVSEGWLLSTDAKTLTHQDALTDKTAVVLTTITGLNPALEAAGTDIEVTNDAYELKDDGTAYENVSTSGVITLSAKALEGTKTVKFKESTKKYAFAFADDVYADGQNEDEWKAQNIWVTNGTTANYMENYDKEHYEIKSTDGSIAVVAASKTTPTATIKGIKKDTEITEDQFQDGLVTLNSTQLDGKTVTLTSTVPGYALALDATDTEIVESTLANKKWKTSGTKATLTGTLTAGYKVSADGKTITYTAKDTANKTIATVAGIKNPVSIKDSVAETTKTITLNKAQLAGTKVTVTNSMPDYEKYTLALGADVSAPVIDETSMEWAAKGDTATLTSKIKTAGYTVTPDEQTIAYTAATTGTKVATLATIKGINQSPELAATLPTLLKAQTDKETRIITLRNELLSTTATVDGKDLFAFEFEDDYSNKAVVGTANSDNLTVNGTGVSVNAGKGNDIIDFTLAGGNTLVYASGDGDDIVLDFTDSDIIKSDKVVITGDNIKTVNGNVVVTIGKNTITLDSYAGSPLTITDKNGTKTYEQLQESPFWTESTTASDVLLADNNYSADAAALSDIVEPSHASYTPYDFEGGLDLVKKDSFAPAVTYTGDDKK